MKRNTPEPPAPRRSARSRIALVIAIIVIALGAWWLIKPAPPPTAATSTDEPAAIADAANDPEPAAVARAGRTQSPASKAAQDKLRKGFQRAVAAYVFTQEVNDAEIRSLLAEFRVREAITLTQKQAAAGSTDALIILSQMNEVCRWRNWDGKKNTRAQTDESESSARADAAKLPAGLRENIETALVVERQYTDAWLDACGDVKLDAAGIEQQLRLKAESGDEASLRALADLSSTRDEDRLRLLTSAALLGDQEAMVAVASTYYFEVTNNNLAHLEEMKQWLDAAARVSPHGKYLLGDCRLKGCDGQPPDVERGLALMREAARYGDGFALKQLADVITAGTGSFTNEEQYAWLLFEAATLDTGCVSPASYARARPDNWHRIQAAERGLSPYQLANAKLMGDQYVRAYGAQAVAGCNRSG